MSKDKAKLRIPIGSSRDSAAGVSAAYILRRLAARAGAYAPGIQEHLFHQITTRSHGASLGKVEQWLQHQSEGLAYLGYNIVSRRTMCITEEAVGWVNDGMGFRAAIVSVDTRTLYQDTSARSEHAVALVRHDETSGIQDQDLEAGVVVVDPAPGRTRVIPVPDSLQRAHFIYKYQTILIFWAGYS